MGNVLEIRWDSLNYVTAGKQRSGAVGSGIKPVMQFPTPGFTILQTITKLW